MAGKRQKAPETLQNKRGGRGKAPVLLEGRSPESAAPAPPEGLTERARQAWDAFWRSPIAGAVNWEADGEALRRWVEALSDREALAAEVRAHPTVPGSMGQDVVNPRATLVARLTKEIQRAEEHFGMTPLARMRLGIAIGEAKRSLADLAEDLDDDGDDGAIEGLWEGAG